MRLPGSQASPDGLGVSAGRLRLRTTRVGTFPVRRRTLCDSSALSLEQLSLRLGSAFARVFTESAGLWDNAVAGITMTAGFLAHAVPTAREAPGRPSRRAISPYVITCPGGIVRRNSKTSRSKG